MNKALLLLLISITLTIQTVNAQSTSKERLEKHVYTLASDSLMGRKAGSEHGHRAAEYIVRQFKETGIIPYKENTYYQSFGNGYKNIIGIIEGSDPLLKDEYIIVGAHYDHLGFRINQSDTVIYNGADDNASGVATLLELAKDLKREQSRLKRSIILIAFDAEEIGLLGSQHFVDNSFVPLEQIKLMISVDMVGWLKTSGEVKYSGSGTIQKGKELISDQQLIPGNLNVTTEKFETSIFTATDTAPFAKEGIPTLAVTTGLKSPYHKPEDEAHLIDYEGIMLIKEHLKNIVRTVAQDEEYQSSGKQAKKHQSQQRFRIGITANIGSNYHHYTAGAVEGKSATSFGAGLVTQLNFGAFGIRPEVHYDRIRAKHPSGNIYTDNITVPLSFVLQSVESGLIGLDISLGGYYSYRFNGMQGGNKLNFDENFNRNEWGWTLGFGFNFGPLKLGCTGRQALTNFTKISNADNAHVRNRTTYFTITYLF